MEGFNQRNENLNNRETKLLPDALTNNYSAFGLLQHTFFGKLKIQGGLRYDTRSISTQAIGLSSVPETYRPAINKNYGSFSGSAGSTLNLTDKLLFRLNIADAYRTPNLAELTSNGQHETRFEIGDINLKPEKSRESDMSIHYHRENFTFEISAFYNNIRNYIFISPTGDTTSSGTGIFRYRQADSFLFGGEADLHYHPGHLNWLHFETTFSTVTGKQDNGNYLPFIPASKLRFELRVEKEKFLTMQKAFISLYTTSVARQNHPAPEETSTNGYTLVDMSAGGSFKIKGQLLSVSVSANNIFDLKYIDHLSTLKEVGYFNPGRNIALSIKMPFAIKGI
jgi:iron complex outermembrane receptor protein